MDNRKVIVIGAGAAGMNAAYTLRKRGVNAEILEAKDHAGGRIAGEYIDGFYVDTGAKFFTNNYRTALGLAEELGLPTVKGPKLSGSGRIYRKGKMVKTRKIDLLLLRNSSLKSVLQTLKLRRNLYNRRKDDFLSGDYTRLLDFDTPGESIGDWLKKNIGEEFVDEICEFLLVSTSLAGPESMGTVFGMQYMWNPMFDPGQHYLNPSIGVGGFGLALADACKDFTRLSTPVERVVIEDGEAKGVITKQGFEAADAVICATTSSESLAIMPDLPRDVIESLKNVAYSGGCHIAFGVDGHPLPRDTFIYLFPRMPGYNIVSYLDATVVSPEAAPEGKSVIHAYTSGNDLFPLSDEEIIRQIIEEIQRHYPDMPDEPVFSKVYRWKEAACIAPGGMLTDMLRMRGGVEGVHRLFLAGEHMYLPGVDGTLNSGFNAADDVVKFLASKS